MTGFDSKRNMAQDKMALADAYALTVAATPNMPTPLERKLAVERIERARNALEAALEQQQAEPGQEPYESPYNPTPVEYQYHYPNGLWRCSNGEVINGLQPDRARSLYALKDNT